MDNDKANKDSPKTRAPPVSQSARAGLQFPVGRIHRYLKNRTIKKTRVGVKAAVYTAAVLEYVIAEVLELAGNESKAKKLKRITPRHIQLAVRGDEELDALLKGIIPGGGVLPHIPENMLIKSEMNELEKKEEDGWESPEY